MRRLVLPLVLLAIAVAGAVLAVRSDDKAAGNVAVLDGPPGPAVATPVLSARRVPEFLRAPIADSAIAADMAEAISASPPSTCLVVHRGDETVYDHLGDQPLTPASTLKLVTALTALDTLGADTVFSTEVRATTLPADGVITGDLWLVGGGDPMLATDAYTARYGEPRRIESDFESLADQILAAGVTEITGSVLADESRYDRERYVLSWPERYAEQDVSGPLSALNVNDGFAAFPTDNGSNAASTAAAEPAQNAAALLRQLLTDRGITVSGGTATGEVAPSGLVALARIDSPSVAAIVGDMLQHSDNNTAELLLKEIGLRSSGTGSSVAGATAVRAHLAERDLRFEGAAIFDGSGLDPQNRVTCDLLVDILTSAPAALIDGLSVSGEVGTLQNRLADPTTEGRLRGKTGFINGVNAIAGIADSDGGQQLVFAYITNEESIVAASEYYPVQDAAGEDLLDYPDGPELAELAPLPPVDPAP